MAHGVEMPSMLKSSLSNSTYSGAAFALTNTASSTPHSTVWAKPYTNWEEETKREQTAVEKLLKQKGFTVADAPKNEEVDLRIVKIVIADVDKNLPVDSRIIHNGVEQVTDLTDDELFFEVPIVDLLKSHNTLRAKTLNKPETAKAGKDVFLEPIRIRDLRMVVVDIADFSN